MRERWEGQTEGLFRSEAEEWALANPGHSDPSEARGTPKIINSGGKYYEYGIFLLEMSLLDCRFSKYQQNLIATTVCFIVKKLFNKDLKIEKFLENTKINLEELKNCLIDICFLLENIQASCYHAVTKKHNKILGDFQKIIF